MTTSVFKRVSVLILCVVLFLGRIPVSASSIKIAISPQSVLVNGVQQKFETYMISVVKGQPYTDVGGEMKIGEDKCQTNDCRCFGR